MLFTEKHALIPHINKKEYVRLGANSNYASIWLKEEKKNIDMLRRQIEISRGSHDIIL